MREEKDEKRNALSILDEDEGEHGVDR